MARVQWRGVTVDDRTRDMLNEVARLTPGLPTLSPSQGSYNTSVSASAGTHAGGGAVDLRASNLTASQTIEVVRVMRVVGFAAWRRLASEGPWSEHIHAIAVGQSDLSPAAARQVDALRAGRNGLANNGLDPHRNLGLPVVTWEQYREGDGIVALPRKGDKGDHVQVIQRMLHATGHDTIPKGSKDTDSRFDGHYGDWTQAAVESSRKALSSSVDPKVDRVTPWHYMALVRELGRSASAPAPAPAPVDEAGIVTRVTRQVMTAIGSAISKAA